MAATVERGRYALGGVPLRYSVPFLVLAAACVRMALAAWDSVGWAAAVPLYAALSFALLAAAYAGAGPRLLLERATGCRSALGCQTPSYPLQRTRPAILLVRTRSSLHADRAAERSFGNFRDG